MADVELRAPRSTGRVLSTPGSIGLVIEGHWAWYRKNWRATAISSVLQPVLFLAAFGLGFGALVGESPALRDATGGVAYLVYLAPALLVVGAVQNAATEATFPVLSAFQWQRTYWGVSASPITPAQLGLGVLVWITARLTVSCAAFLLIAMLFGAVQTPAIVLGLVFAVLAGVAFAAPLAAFAATQKSAEKFNAVFRFVVIPMTLFSGTFYPIEQLPWFIRPLAWLSPLWHGTELSRGVTLGGLDVLPALGHIAVLVGLLTVGAFLTVSRFRRRLAE